MAGAAKIMQAPQEMEFLQGLGLSLNVILAFGVIQVLGAILLAIPKTRLSGAIITTLVLLISVVLLYLNDNMAMALISIIPAGLAGFIVQQTLASGSKDLP